ncbi:hypothetical protein M0R04_13535 [Candidatus Dojkabacteria bacterium]|jgi:hypothetical protein|nr:hypothetical protein [Candidatus Dojkabacteria bacterium]
MEFLLKRNEVEEQIKILVQNSQNKDLVKDGIKIWLDEKGVSSLEAQQIMNDLTSYQDYLSLLN